MVLAVGCATGVGTDSVGDANRILSPEVRSYLMQPDLGSEDIPSDSLAAAQGVFDRILSGDLSDAREALGRMGR